VAVGVRSRLKPLLQGVSGGRFLAETGLDDVLHEAIGFLDGSMGWRIPVDLPPLY